MDLEGIMQSEMSDRETNTVDAEWPYIFFFFPVVQLGMRNFLPPGIKPVPPALEAWGLNHWATREVLWFHLHVES